MSRRAHLLGFLALAAVLAAMPLFCSNEYELRLFMLFMIYASEIASREFVAIGIVKPTPSWRLSVVLSRRTINMWASESVADVMANEIKGMVQSGVWRAKLKVSQRRAFSGKGKHR